MTPTNEQIAAMLLPLKGHVYIAGPRMDEGRASDGSVVPSWFVGRRVLVRRILTRRQMQVESGYTPPASSDIDLRKGNPMPDLHTNLDEPNTIEIAVLGRGRVQTEFVPVDRWDAVPVPRVTR